MNPILKILFYPLSMLYGGVMALRNGCFNIGLIKEKKYPIPIINVGNLSVGGTGKTPHVEYLVSLLSTRYKIAILSKGYKRKTKGYLKANASHTHFDIGDEPLQYFKKFPNITVSVCKSRRKGIECLLSETEPPQLIILDDAYQHRFVKPSTNILLTDYMNLYISDFVLPSGKLREFRSGFKRADFVVVTKTENVLSSLVKGMITNDLNVLPHQQLFFSRLDYSTAIPLYNTHDVMPDSCVYIQILSGIANPYPLQAYLKNRCSEIKLNEFPDHHQFTKKEIQKVVTEFKNHLSVKKVMVTTEKDAQRLKKEEFRRIFEGVPIFYIPITVKFHNASTDTSFDQMLLDRIATEIKG